MKYYEGEENMGKGEKLRKGRIHVGATAAVRRFFSECRHRYKSEKKRMNKPPITLTSSNIICICRTIMPFSAQHILAILFGDMVHSDRVLVRKRQSESERERVRE